ncbi:MAG: PhnD/SsuA/transferrin family substrate-binding protein [Ignavibacteria bacterium]|jgi:ABC-type phosphate/phosphonate transport system substrate-binding protein
MKRYDLQILFLFYFICTVSNYGQNSDNLKDTLWIGIPSSYLDATIKERDAKAAFKIWTDYYSGSLEKKSDVNIVMKFILYEGNKTIENDIISQKLDIVSLPVYEYFTGKGIENYEVKLSGLRSQSKFTKFLIIINTGSGIKTIKNFLDLEIYIPSGEKNSLMILWLKKILYENGVNAGGNLLDKITTVDDEKKIIYSVFFDKNRAAIIRKDVLELVAELNPQLKKKIYVLAESDNYIENVTLLRKSLSDKLRRIIITNATKFHETTKELQIMNLFKVNKLVEITGEELQSSIELLKYIKSYEKNIK